MTKVLHQPASHNAAIEIHKGSANVMVDQTQLNGPANGLDFYIYSAVKGSFEGNTTNTTLPSFLGG